MPERFLCGVEQFARGRRIGEISRYEGGIQFARQGLTGFNGDIAENGANPLRNQRFCNSPPNAGCCSGD
jgi:hypothetical protein